jgi:hypothetical protein
MRGKPAPTALKMWGLVHLHVVTVPAMVGNHVGLARLTVAPAHQVEPLLLLHAPTERVVPARTVAIVLQTVVLALTTVVTMSVVQVKPAPTALQTVVRA